MSDARAASGPKPLAGLEAIAPYVPGDSHLDGRADVIKLSSNESALGPSPAAREAYAAAAAKLHFYPDGGSTALREAIGALFKIDPARIVCGAGSDELLQFIGRAFVAPQDEVLYSRHGFLVYPLVAKQCRATGVAAPERNLTTDVDALLERVSARTKVVFLANPNNPTGTYLSSMEIRRLHAGLPSSTLLVLDEAYGEFVDRADYESGLALARSAGNVVVTRTFSKIYGLASARVGWMYASASVVEAIHKVRGPFNVSGPAIAAGVAALEDQAFVARAKAHNLKERARLEGVAEQLGLLAVRGVCNFVLLRFSDAAGKTAADADAFLRARGVILRGMVAYGLPDCLRATVGTAEQNDRLITVLHDFAGAA
jgi:histidinol-phosphate aminotransferase